MAFGVPLSEAFYHGRTSSSPADVGLWSVALGGRPFELDLSEPRFVFRSVPLLRQQADQSDLPGEASINPEGLWRRFTESWHKGAGQDDFDRKESDPFRFRSSKGIDPWTKWQISLHRSVTNFLASAETNLFNVVAGSRLYFASADDLAFTTATTYGMGFAPTAVTGMVGGTITGIASDGFNVWTAHGSNGIYRTTRTSGSGASHITGTVEIVGYSKGRVLAANNNSVYDVTTLAQGSSGALPAALFTHGNTDFQWVGFADTPGFIYLAGFSGDKSLIYRTELDDDGTGLLPPVVAGTLPDGEIVYSVYGYLGFLFIGTSKGVRFAAQENSGALNIGALIETSAPVRCFEGQGRFVWFGWSDYDAADTGLGRLDLSTFGDAGALIPAWASDIMAADTQGDVKSIVTFGDRLYFSVAGEGFHVRDTDSYVPSGTLDTGDIGFGLADQKVGLFFDIASRPTGTYNLSLSADSGDFDPFGSQVNAGSDRTLAAGQVEGVTFEMRLTLSRDADDESLAPVIKSWLFRAQPIPQRTNVWEVPIRVAPVLKLTSTGQDEPMDTIAALDWISDLVSSGRLVQFQLGTLRSYAVVVDDFELLTKRLTVTPAGINGTVVVKLKEVA